MMEIFFKNFFRNFFSSRKSQMNDLKGNLENLKKKYMTFRNFTDQTFTGIMLCLYDALVEIISKIQTKIGVRDFKLFKNNCFI